MDDIQKALQSLAAIRDVEQIARDLAKSPDQADVAARYARDVVESIERFVRYLSITSRSSITPN